MRLLRLLLQPSLVRRVTVAMLAAFVMVWVVSMAFLYYRVKLRESNQADRQQWSAQQVSVIARFDSDEQVKAAAEVTSERINLNNQHNGTRAFLLQVARPNGAVLYLSPQAGGKALPPGPARNGKLAIDGRDYFAYYGQTPGLRITLADPVPELPWMLRRMSDDLTIFVVLAFPVVLLPMWFAVGRGLRPLRRLSASIASRGPDDLRPLNAKTDYAEIEPLTAALERLLGQLRAKMEREHAFVADAAHELRTPMAVIAAQAHVLVKADGMDQRLAAEQKLEHAIARASHLIQQLLELAHIDSDERRALAVLDVAALARHELALLAPAAIARQLDLSLDAPDVLLHAAESHAFQSILQNLVVNAIRYVQDGGSVAVSLTKSDSALTLTVSDNGPGIAPEQRELVFERFYRGQAHDVHGSGLGLAIVRQACARLGGSVALAAGAGGAGCVFTVTLPSTAAG